MGESNSKVSLAVVIPNYNHAAYLAEALDSVVSQSQQLETILVIDDASTDQSVDLIRRYVREHSKVTLIQKNKNCGLFANINEIIPQLETTHAMFLAADDYVLPGHFESVRAILSEYPQSGYCMANSINLFPDGRQRPFDYGLSTRPTYYPPSQVPRVARGIGITGQGFYNLEGLRKMGGFPESLAWHADHFVCWVLAARHGLCYIPEAGTAFRQSPSSISGTGMHGPGQWRVYENFLRQLHRPEFADVKDKLSEAHVLRIFSDLVFRTLWKEEQLRAFLTPSFVTLVIWLQLRRVIRHPVPRLVKKWFRSKS